MSMFILATYFGKTCSMIQMAFCLGVILNAIFILGSPTGVMSVKGNIINNSLFNTPAHAYVSGWPTNEKKSKTT